MWATVMTQLCVKYYNKGCLMFILRKKLYYTSTEEKKKIKASHFLCLSKLINEEA